MSGRFAAGRSRLEGIYGFDSAVYLPIVKVFGVYCRALRFVRRSKHQGVIEANLP